MWETLVSWDKTLFLFLNGAHTPYWDHFASIFTGKWVWGVMYASILYVLCRNYEWRTVVAATVAIVLVIVAADQLTSSVLRPFFARPRPSHEPTLAGLVHLIDGRRGGAFGFPSAHAANTAALTTFLICFFRQRAMALFFVAWTLGTCYTRVYVGVHYPSDLVCGVVVGMVGGGAVYGLFRLAMAAARGGRPRVAPGASARVPVIVHTGLITTGIIGLYSFFL
jgi:undecaprenyl-diphosphatase